MTTDRSWASSPEALRMTLDELALHRHERISARCPLTVGRCEAIAAELLERVTDANAGQVPPQLAADAVWLAKLARGSSWPGDMAQRVEQAAEYVISTLSPMEATE